MKKKAIFMCLLIISVVFIQAYLFFPNRLMVFVGENYNIYNPFRLDMKAGTDNPLEVSNQSYQLDLLNPLVITPQNLGHYDMDFNLFGVIPFKKVNIDVMPRTSLVPCGNSIGVKLYTDGIFVIGISDVDGLDGVKYQPWKKPGIREGDIITSMNGIALSSTEQLTQIVDDSNGNQINMIIRRKHKIFEIQIIPAKALDEKYKLGLWVRDSTAGIGTMTFYDPQTNNFAALGHGITDVDTGQILTVGKGDVLSSSIVSIRKGKRGDPGELKGMFMGEQRTIGTIAQNCDYGLYGVLKEYPALIERQPIPVALRSDIAEGAAQIYSNIEGEKVEKFDIEIQKVMHQNDEGSKGMIIKVTDPSLLDRTGGIVQGMSGSPIVQEGKLVGAVTHVFVNDPTRGYGIFVEWMLNRMSG